MTNKIAVIALISLAPVYGAHNNNASCSSDNGALNNSTLSNSTLTLSDSGSIEKLTYVQIESAEGHVFTIDEKVALQSGTIAGMLAPEVRKMMCNSGEPIQFNELSSASLSVLFRLMQYAHKNVSVFGMQEQLEKILPKDKKTRSCLLQELVLAQSFLDIKAPSIKTALIWSVFGMQEQLEKILPKDKKTRSCLLQELVLSQSFLDIKAPSIKTALIWAVDTYNALDSIKNKERLPLGLFKPYLLKTVKSALNSYIGGLMDSRVFKGHKKGVYSAAFSRDGTKIVSASSDKTVRIWDASTGKCLHVLEGHTGVVNLAAFSQDGTKIVTASSDRTVRIWDVNKGRCLHVLKEHTQGVRSAAFSSDGTKIVTISADKAVRIWDASTGKCLHVLKGYSYTVGSAVFSQDGTKIASVSYTDDTVRIWDASTGQFLRILRGHTNFVSSAKFSQDGKKIASVSSDRTVRIWDVNTGQCLHVLKGHGGAVNSAAFSQDGTKIVSASSDGTVRIWFHPVDNCDQAGIRLLYKALPYWRKKQPYQLSSDAQMNVYQKLPKQLKNEKLFWGNGCCFW